MDRLTLRVVLEPVKGWRRPLPKRQARHPETPQTLLSRLFARLGEDSCSGLRTQDDPRPERSTTTLRPRFIPSPRGSRARPGRMPSKPPLEGASWRGPGPSGLPRPQRLSGARAQPRYRGKTLHAGRAPLLAGGTTCRGPRHAPGLLGSPGPSGAMAMDLPGQRHRGLVPPGLFA